MTSLNFDDTILYLKIITRVLATTISRLLLKVQITFCKLKNIHFTFKRILIYFCYNNFLHLFKGFLYVYIYDIEKHRKIVYNFAIESIYLKKRIIMLNYSNLSDVEFEYLCQDIMQRKLNVSLHKYAVGRDNGIDLCDDSIKKSIVIQVKHYINSTVSNLINTLKTEVKKVNKLNPKQYYICCSKALSPQKVNEIYNMFSPFMDSSSNIITISDIDDFLNASENFDILKKHYKLWIESTGILENIIQNDTFIDCEVLFSTIEKDRQVFVPTIAYYESLKLLDKRNTLFIVGNPGVGKTLTSKMLILHYAANGYKVRYTTNTSDLQTLKKTISQNPEEKEIILIDDCFGQAYFKMKETQSNELTALIKYVSISTNKLLILNSRITIFKESKNQCLELVSAI